MPNDKPTYLAPGSYVKQVGERPNGEPLYQAGPRSKKYDKNEIVPNSYAKSVLGSVNYRNRVFGLIERGETEREKAKQANRDPSNVEIPTNYQDAQEIVSEFNNLTQELNKAQEQENQERIEEIERDIQNLRAKMGS